MLENAMCLLWFDRKKMGIRGNGNVFRIFGQCKRLFNRATTRYSSAMFTYMNVARIGRLARVATERLYQGALTYALERLAMTTTGVKIPMGLQIKLSSIP